MRCVGKHAVSRNNSLKPVATSTRYNLNGPLLLQNRNTPLYWAAAGGHVGAMRLLLAAGADPATHSRVRNRTD